MTVSVVIATLGAHPLLEPCVRAIGAGSRRPDELVVVDQGTALTGDRLRGWLGDDGIALTHLVHPPLGVSRARNVGVDAAAGELLAFTDDDCVPEPGWLAALLAGREAHGTDGATGRVLPLDTGRPGLVAVSSRTSERPQGHAGTGARPWEAGTGGNLLLTRDAYGRAGGFDVRFGPGGALRAAEDVEFLDRVLQTGASLAYEPDAVVRHEMKAPRDRLARRYPYGFGMGALAATRPSPRRAAVTRAYLRMQARALMSGVRHADGRRALEPVLSTAGFVAGAWAARGR